MDNYKNIKLVTHISDDLFKIDFSEIVAQKHIIPMQYEEINIGGNSDDLHKLSKKVDRYLLHIIEEITEFLEEVDKIDINIKTTKLNYKTNKDCLMELIDVIAYISSLLSIFCIDYYGLDRIKKYNTVIDSHFILSDYIQNNDKDFINDSLLEIEKTLILKVRREFPERKWHKDVNRILSIQELSNLYKICMNSTRTALENSICLFLHLTGGDCDLFNKMFLEKNEVVYSLKK